MYKYLASIILLLLLCNFAFGQEEALPKDTKQEETQTTFTNSIPDSIQILLDKKGCTRTERVEALTVALDHLVLLMDFINMKPYIQELYEISNNSNNLYYKSLYNYYNGIFLSKDNSFSAIENYFKSLEQLYKLPESYKNQILKVNNYNALGIYYFTNDMLLEAYETFKKGLAINNKLNIKKLDLKLKTNLAAIYLKIGLNKEGFILNNEILNAYKNNQKEDLINKSAVLNNISCYYYDIFEYDSAMIYLDSIIYFTKTPCLYSLFLTNIGEIYINKDEIEKAESCFRESLKLSFNNKIIDIYNLSTILIGNIKILKKQYDSALIYAEKAIELSKKYKLLIYERDGLLLKKQALENLNRCDECLETIKEYDAISDSIEKIQNIEGVKKSIFKKEILEKEKEFNKTIEEQNYRNKKEKVSLILIIILLLIIVIILIYIYKLSVDKKKILLNNKKIKEEALSKELDLRNRELTSNMLSQIKYNDILSDIVEKLSKIPTKGDEIENNIQLLITYIKHSINKGSYDNFEYYFVKVHPDFFNKLLSDYPDLTQQELRICAFTKLNIPVKDIASIINVTPSAIRNTKWRMRRKLNLTDSEESLIYFLSKY